MTEDDLLILYRKPGNAEEWLKIRSDKKNEPMMI